MRRATWLVAVAAGLLPLLVYLRTLHPGLPGGDSGELIAVAHGLGIAHPPGYPLWTWLANAFGRIVAVGDYAWRLNLMSALLHAAACSLLALTLLRLGIARALALAAAWMFGLAAATWKNALVAEVFPLSTCMAAAMLYCFARLLSDPRELRALAALWALSAAILVHHHTLLLLALPLWLLLLPRLRAVPLRSARPWLVAVVLLLIAWSPLLHLLREPSGPAPWWGRTQDWEGLLYHLLRRDYGMLSLDPEQSGLRADTPHLWLYLRSWPASLAPGLLGLLALPWALRGRRALAMFFVLFALAQSWFFTRVGFPTEPKLLLGVIERFYLLPHLVAVVAMALGWQSLRDRLPRRRLVDFALPLVCVALPVSLHFERLDQRDNRMLDELMENLLRSAPPAAVLFSIGDVFHNGLAFKQQVQGMRPDLLVVDQELLTKRWYSERVRARDPELLPPWPREGRYSGAPETLNLLWLRHLEGRRTALFLGVKEPSLEAEYVLLPRGLLFQAVPKDRQPELPEQLQWQLELLRDGEFSTWLRPQDPWSFEAAEQRRTPQFLERLCLMLCQPAAQAVRASEHPELARLKSLLVEHAASVAPWPFLRRAAGYVAHFHPDFQDDAFARAELRAALDSGEPMPDAEQMRAFLATLDQRKGPAVDSPRAP